MSKQTLRDILRFAVGAAILAAVQEIVILVLVLGFKLFDGKLAELLLGTLYGTAYIILSFIHMGFCVEKCIEKDENQAKLYMQTRYTARMLVMIGVLIAAVYIPFINIYTAVIPLLFTRIVVTFMGRKSKKAGAKK